MSKVNWLSELGWTDDHLEDLRFAGYAYIRQGKYDIALTFFEALNILDTSNLYDAQTLGALYLQLNEPGKALKCLDRALKLEGDHGPTLINMAKALFMLGRKEEGVKLANILQNDENLYIANTATALLIAYS